MSRSRVIAFCLGVLAASHAANATTITLTVGAGGAGEPNPDYILGEIIPPESGMPGGQVARDLLMVNTLLQMGLGSSSPIGDTPWYYRSTTDYGLSYPLNAATASNAVPIDGGFVVVGGYLSITPTSGYQYLVATWDGQNSGSQAWYIGDIAAGTELRIPYAVNNVGPGGHLEVSDKHELTHYTLINPIPDGGATAGLLGLTMLALGFARRRKA